MTPNLLTQGLELMLIGMGTVFAFLTLLVLATAAMSRLVLRFQPAEPADTSGPDEAEVAAITAAIRLHRRRR